MYLRLAVPMRRLAGSTTVRRRLGATDFLRAHTIRFVHEGLQRRIDVGWALETKVVAIAEGSEVLDAS